MKFPLYRVQDSENRTVTPEPKLNRTVQYLQPGRIPSKKDNKTIWISTIPKTPRPKVEEKVSTMSPEDLTVMPLQEQVDHSQNSVRRNPSISNRSDEQLFIGAQESIESFARATSASVYEGKFQNKFLAE